MATGPAQSTISLENNDDDDDAEHAYGSDFEVNRKYLTFSWWLLNRGWIEVMERVEAAVRDVFGHLSPRDLLSFDTFSQLTFEVRKKIEGGSGDNQRDSKWLRTLMPPQTLEDFVLRESGVMGDSATATTSTGAADEQKSSSSDSTSTPTSTSSLRHLIDETSDLIESPAFSHVFTLLLDAGFSVLLNQKLLQGAFDSSSSTTTGPAVIPEEQPLVTSNVATKAVLLPKMLSVLTRQAHVIGNGMPNEYLEEMERVRELEAFAAVVYSSNWENEIRGSAQDDYLPSKILEEEDAGPDYDETLVASNTSAAASAAVPKAEEPSQVTSAGDESLVMVDPSQQTTQTTETTETSFESAWERATATTEGEK